MVGKISHLVSDKGYGFIQAEGYEKGIFFHAKALKNTTFDDLVKGDDVEISGISQSEKGFAASAVSLKF